MDYEKIKNNKKKKVMYTDAKTKMHREHLFAHLWKYWNES